MPRAAMFGYSLASVARTHRRSAVVILGLSLAVAIVAAPAIALDSEVRTVVNRLLATVPYDFEADGSTASYDSAAQAAAGVSGVANVQPLVPLPPGTTYLASGGGNGSPPLQAPIVLDFVHASFGSVAPRFELTGSFDLQSNELAITDRIAVRLGLSQGGTVALVNRYYTCSGPTNCTYTNYTATMTVASVLATPLPSADIALEEPLGYTSSHDLAFASLDGLTALAQALNLPLGNPPTVTLFIWADRASLIDPYDPVGSATRVLHLEREITSGVANWGFRVFQGFSAVDGTLLEDIVGRVNDATGLQRGFLAIFAFPTVILAFLFTRVGFDTGLAKRRREVGILRSRGSTPGSVMAALLIEAVLLGAIAAALGLAIAVAVSRVFLGFVNASFVGGTSFPLTDIAISPQAVLLALAAAVGVAFLVAYAPVRRASEVRIVQALRVTSTFETGVDYAEARFVVFLLIGLAGLFFIFGAAGALAQGGLISFLLGGILTILLVFAPILLILAVVRFLTLGSNRPYRALARLVRPWLGDLDFLVVEGVRRAPRRSSNLAVIVSFGLAFAMFVVSLAGMAAARDVRVAHTVVGGDLSVTSGALNPADVPSMGQVSGVSAAVPVSFMASNYGILAAVNGSSYAAAVSGIDGYYFVEGSPAVVPTLFGDGGILANAVAARALGLHLGDPIVLTITVGGARGTHVYTVRVHVTGVVLALPGLQQSGGSVDVNSLLILDTQTLTAWGVSEYPAAYPGMRVLIRTQPGADPDAVAKALQDRWPVSAVVYNDVLASLTSDPFQAALEGQLYTSAGMAVVVAVLAVSVMAYASAADREGEFATILVRGVTRRQLNTILFGEALSVGLVGALPAIPMVFVFLWAFLKVSAVLTPASLPFEFILPTAVWLVLISALGALLLGALAAGLRLRWMNVPRVLKLRGL